MTQKRVFLVHGWGDTPQSHWYQWFKKTIEAKGFVVDIPTMPEPNVPEIDKWVPYLKEKVGTADKDTYLIGFSLGCNAVLRYIEDLEDDVRIGGAIFVAGFTKELNFSTFDDPKGAEMIAAPWLHNEIDIGKVALHINKSVAIFSDNDPYVPLSNTEFYKELGSKIIIQQKSSHFRAQDGFRELHVLLNEFMKMTI